MFPQLVHFISLTRHPSSRGPSSHGQSLAEEVLVDIAFDLEAVHSSFVAVGSLVAGVRHICEVERVSPKDRDACGTGVGRQVRVCKLPPW